jgi:hypothetical protein
VEFVAVFLLVGVVLGWVFGFGLFWVVFGCGVPWWDVVCCWLVVGDVGRVSLNFSPV